MGRIQDILAQRRQKSEIELDNRLEQIYKKVPELKEIEKNLQALNLQRIQNLIYGLDVDRLTLDINKLLSKKDELIIKNSINPKDFEIQHTCELCKDTGVYNRKTCSCKKQLMLENVYTQSSISERVKYENFDRFNLNIFRKDRMSNEIISPYENMKKNLHNMKVYAETFNSKSLNLYIFGPVGTGKTFMSMCIAKKVMDRGFSVIYQSASELIDNLTTYQFMNANEKLNYRKNIDLLYNSDLLIIDDLGTEIISEISKSVLVEIVNQRLVKRKPTIISSNIDIDDIDDYYGARLFSRIMGQYETVKFYGNDVRLLSEDNNRI